LAGETEVLGESVPSATLSTINPTLSELGSNPATNCLSYATAGEPLPETERHIASRSENSIRDNKKFWEEQTAYFSLSNIDPIKKPNGRHRHTDRNVVL
jgi:hypothetical protein